MEHASAELNKAVSLRPDFAEAWSDLGEARKACGRRSRKFRRAVPARVGTFLSGRGSLGRDASGEGLRRRSVESVHSIHSAIGAPAGRPGRESRVYQGAVDEADSREGQSQPAGDGRAANEQRGRLSRKRAICARRWRSIVPLWLLIPPTWESARTSRLCSCAGANGAKVSRTCARRRDGIPVITLCSKLWMTPYRKRPLEQTPGAENSEYAEGVLAKRNE